MESVQAIILGFIQGASEFLPISSSGHLILIPNFFKWKDQGLAFDVALHWGTLIAVVSYFFKDWVNIIKKSFLFGLIFKKNANDGSLYINHKNFNGKFCNNSLHSKLCNNLKSDFLFIIAVSTIPGIIVGVFLNNLSETVFRSYFLISATLFLGAVVLFYADKVGKKHKNINNINLRDGIVIGIFQAIAIVPGISRSGITIAAALLLGFNRTASARFSFLLSVPIILGAGILEFPSLLSKNGMGFNVFLGVAASAISGYLAIKYILIYLERKNYNIFVVYRILLAFAIILYYI